MKAFLDRLTVFLMGALYFSALWFIGNLVFQWLEVGSENAWYELVIMSQGGMILAACFAGFIATLYLASEFISPRVTAASCGTALDRVKFFAIAIALGILTPLVLPLLISCFIVVVTLVLSSVVMTKVRDEIVCKLLQREREDTY